MIKKDIAEVLYEEHGGMSRAETAANLDALLAILAEAMQDGEVQITHFGKFKPRSRSVREINLPDGRPVLTRGDDRVQFLPAAALKHRLNQS